MCLLLEVTRFDAASIACGPASLFTDVVDGGSGRAKSSILHLCFSGELRVVRAPGR